LYYFLIRVLIIFSIISKTISYRKYFILMKLFKIKGNILHLPGERIGNTTC
jgi:hypothetical protein